MTLFCVKMNDRHVSVSPMVGSQMTVKNLTFYIWKASKCFVLFCFLRKQWSCLLNCQSGYQDNFPLFSKVKKTWVCKVANRSLEMRCVVGSDPAVVLAEWIAAAGWRQSGCVLGIFARLMWSKLEVLFMESTFSHLDCKITSRLQMNFSTWPPTQVIFFSHSGFLFLCS